MALNIALALLPAKPMNISRLCHSVSLNTEQNQTCISPNPILQSSLRTDPSVLILFMHSIENIGKNGTFLSAAFYSSSRNAKSSRVVTKPRI